MQDHGNPVRYRNIWVRELPEWNRPSPSGETTEPVITLTPEILDRYTGEYKDERERSFVIRREGFRVYAQVFNRPNLELLVYSKQEFDLRWTAGRMVFELNSEGVPTGVILLVGRAKFPAKKIN